MTKKQALEKSGYVPRLGRPPVGSASLDSITVPAELKAALEKTAAVSGHMDLWI